jgi:hypothetical protein
MDFLRRTPPRRRNFLGAGFLNFLVLLDAAFFRDFTAAVF